MSRRTRNRAARALPAALLLAALLAAGCATTHVHQYQREHLADPIMSFEAEARANARQMKALEAREGSTGGIGGAGGGCACK